MPGPTGSTGATVVSIYVTAPDGEVARRIALSLVEERLAACVNILPGVLSIYRWESAIAQDKEVVLFAKTQRDRVDDVIARVQALHPHEVPCVLVLPVLAGHGPFLAWVAEQTRDG